MNNVQQLNGDRLLYFKCFRNSLRAECFVTYSSSSVHHNVLNFRLSAIEIFFTVLLLQVNANYMKRFNSLRFKTAIRIHDFTIHKLISINYNRS